MMFLGCPLKMNVTILNTFGVIAKRTANSGVACGCLIRPDTPRMSKRANKTLLRYAEAAAQHSRCT